VYGIRTIQECIGKDPNREGPIETPSRYAKAMLDFTKGYEENLKPIAHNAVFQEDHDKMGALPFLPCPPPDYPPVVMVKEIEIYSMCEHHLVPFTGKMHIYYIPRARF